MMRWTLFIGYLCTCQNAINAFNIDAVNYVRHEGQPDSMFGFSVALHQESKKSWYVSV